MTLGALYIASFSDTVFGSSVSAFVLYSFFTRLFEVLLVCYVCLSLSRLDKRPTAVIRIRTTEGREPSETGPPWLHTNMDNYTTTSEREHARIREAQERAERSSRRVVVRELEGDSSVMSPMTEATYEDHESVSLVYSRNSVLDAVDAASLVSGRGYQAGDEFHVADRASVVSSRSSTLGNYVSRYKRMS